MKHTATTHTSYLVGLTAAPVTITATFDGAHDAASADHRRFAGLSERHAREAGVRVRAALQRHLSTEHYNRCHKVRVTVSGADQAHSAAAFDLAIAVAVAQAATVQEDTAFLDQDLVRTVPVLLLGELSLGGDVRVVRGVISHLEAARDRGYHWAVVPVHSDREAAMVTGMDVRAGGTLEDVLQHLQGGAPLPKVVHVPPRPGPCVPDMADVRGCAAAVRALEIAAAGGHNVLLRGAPGSGKTLLARRLTGILPPCNDEEQLSIQRVISAAGMGLSSGSRPFRAPHHTASLNALLGDARQPGEVSLATHGVLFLDELPEWHGATLEGLSRALRQGKVTCRQGLSGAPSDSFRVVDLPANPQLLVGAMTPCPCGFLGVHRGNRAACVCTPGMVLRHQDRVFKSPLFSLFDIVVDVCTPTQSQRAMAPPTCTSAEIRERVVAARDGAPGRQHGAGHRGGLLLPNAVIRREEVARTIAALDGRAGQPPSAADYTEAEGLEPRRWSGVWS